ncbi:uncharacterized protein LOC131626385 [Vicia villosa]|uniref:uncharacterized protein LOC131626385 n=1 Tax=Vicia villosa TaxID=3911 RepID=UPI00273B45E2|nr:uncharacterized protein LOC131626385 [Vicia villosa]
MFTKKEDGIDWTIILFSLSTLLKTLVMRIPLLTSNYGDFSGHFMFPETVASIPSFKVESNVVHGEIEVQLEEQDLVSELKFWEYALIMYAIGDELSMNGVRKFMLNYWNFVTLPELYYNEEGFFIIRFKSKEDRNEVGHECRKIEPQPQPKKKNEAQPAWIKKKVIEPGECSKTNDTVNVEEDAAWKTIPVSNRKKQKETEITITAIQMGDSGSYGIQDRIGGNEVRRAEYIELEELMNDIGLYEHETRGSHYTWSNKHGQGAIYSRIDIAICNGEWFSAFPRKDYMDTLRESWRIPIEGRPMYICWRKLIRLQKVMISLNRAIADGVKRIQLSRDNLEKVQTMLEEDKFNRDIIEQAKYWTDEIIKGTNIEEKILSQKAKVDWLQLGDGNNRYFHAIVNQKNKQKSLLGLEDQNGKLLTGFQDLEEEILKFYTNLVGTASNNLDHVDIMALRNETQLREDQRVELEQPITVNEITNALKSIGDSKAPGIDGYNAKFYKASWHVIKKEVIDATKEFFQDDRLYPAINCTLVTLIPKHTEARKMKDMRPIACCTTLYKIISKILTVRLSKVIGCLVDPSQSAFIPGRVIHDNILMARELLRRYTCKYLSPKCAIQMDLQKAYDTVEWYALECILREMNFPPHFTKWIMLCMTTASYRYYIHGRQSKILKAKRGLRQGDPMSPLLYVLIMEYLHRCLKKLQCRPQFKFHPKCAKLSIINICFADDIILFTRGDTTSIQLIMEEVKGFSQAIGLKANPQKCKVFFGGVSIDDQTNILAITGFSAGNFPFKYLGVPITSKKLHIALYQPLIDRIVIRIQTWTASILSYAGRRQLIQSVLNAMTSYWMQVYPMPKKVIHHICAICRSFLWSSRDEISRKSPIAWESVSEPKKVGGLNLVDLNCWNKATIIKLLWNLQAKADKLWVMWMHVYYLKGQPIDTWRMPTNCSWIMKKMMSYRADMHHSTYWNNSLQTGKYITKYMYHELRGEKPPTPWYKIFYHNAARPRARFIMWLALWDGLPTKSRLARFGIITDGACVFCKKEETQEHLLFDCVVTGDIWRQILKWIGFDRIPFAWNNCWSGKAKWLYEETARKGWRRMILKAAAAETIYSIWELRNTIIFKGLKVDDKLPHRIRTNIVTRCSGIPKLKNHVNVEELSIR